jgi:polysaccharide pyruvyl transferase WcaK-like protein
MNVLSIQNWVIIQGQKIDLLTGYIKTWYFLNIKIWRKAHFGCF